MSVRRPTWTEALLLVALGAGLSALFLRPADADSAEVPFGAGAAPGITAGGGGVVVATGQGDKSDLLYVVDTTRQRICVYRWINPGIRLVSARAYDYDMEILDSSADRNIEQKGATRGYVKAQVEAARRAVEARPPKAD